MAKKKSIFEGSYKKEEVDASGHVHDEPEEHEESSEKFKEEMTSGEEDEDVYTEEGREELEEDDEISPSEEGFMRGAEGRGHNPRNKKRR